MCDHERVQPVRRTRLARGLAAGSIATFVALVSHVAGGGAIPAPLGVVVPWVLALAVCVSLAGRRLSAIRLTLSVAVSQFLFHVLFTVGSSSVSAPAGHHVGVIDPAIMAGAVGAGAPPDVSMWIGHALAAAATVAALYRGERAVLRIMHFAITAARRMSRAIATRLGSPEATARSLPVGCFSRENAPWDAARRLTPDRRGPPPIAVF